MIAPLSPIGFVLSRHANIRMQQRGISPDQVAATLRYGSRYFARDAFIYVMGKREIRKFADFPGVTPELNGLRVICDKSARVVTCYRRLPRRDARNQPPAS